MSVAEIVFITIGIVVAVIFFICWENKKWIDKWDKEIDKEIKRRRKKS